MPRKYTRKTTSKKVTKKAAVAPKVVELMPASVAAPVVEPAAAVNDPIVSELSEVDVYKIQYLRRNFADIHNAVVGEVRSRYQAALDAELQQTLKNHKGCNEAYTKYAQAVNSVIDRHSENLPEGYVVAKISPETAQVEAVYNPSDVGARLKEQLE